MLGSAGKVSEPKTLTPLPSYSRTLPLFPSGIPLPVGTYIGDPSRVSGLHLGLAGAFPPLDPPPPSSSFSPFFPPTPFLRTLSSSLSVARESEEEGREENEERRREGAEREEEEEEEEEGKKGFCKNWRDFLFPFPSSTALLFLLPSFLSLSCKKARLMVERSEGGGCCVKDMGREGGERTDGW